MSIQPSDLTFSPGAGAVSGYWAVLWSTGAATGVTTTGYLNRLQVEADADQCEGAPHFEVAVDGMTVLTQEVDGDDLYGNGSGDVVRHCRAAHRGQHHARPRQALEQRLRFRPDSQFASSYLHFGLTGVTCGGARHTCERRWTAGSSTTARLQTGSATSRCSAGSPAGATTSWSRCPATPTSVGCDGTLAMTGVGFQGSQA